MPAPHTLPQLAIFAWGVLGVVFLVGDAVFRLLRFAYETLRTRALGPWDISFLLGFLAFILYAEGYRGFQKRFAPRTVARAHHLALNPRPLFVVLAPLYCMALFGTTRKRLIVSWLLIAGIVSVVLLVRLLPPFYRALVDVGVACALLWGIASLIVYSILALRGRPMPVAADAA